jgi:SAM-dependent methyltransferase
MTRIVAMAATGAAPAHARAWRAIVDAARAPYRHAGRFAWHFAKGKLDGDPVFRHLLQAGLIEPRARVLDIGCGQGLLASLLLAADATAHDGGWPAGWAPVPRAVQVTGIDMNPRDIERAQAALGPAATFIRGDMRTTDFPPADAVVILDALHYIGPADQDALLQRARDALRPCGVLVLRVGDAGSAARFALGQAIDKVSRWLRGDGWTALAGRSANDWVARLQALGFDVDRRPMNGRPPFANVLLVGRVQAKPEAP